MSYAYTTAAVTAKRQHICVCTVSMHCKYAMPCDDLTSGVCCPTCGQLPWQHISLCYVWCRCLADLLLKQEPNFDIAPLSATRNAVRPTYLTSGASLLA